MLEYLLKTRFERHIKTRVIDVTKHNHWCLNFTYENIPRLAAMMVFYNHTKTDLNRVDDRTTLLAHPEKYFIAVGDLCDQLDENYLHYDTIKHVCICSGKAAGSNISDPQASLQNREVKHVE